MAQKKYTQLPDSATPTGDEIIAWVQGGASVQGTLQEIADLAPGGASQFRGAWDASSDTYPAAGTGSGTAGAIRAGDEWYFSVGGNLNGDFWPVDTILKAKVNTPGTTDSNWLLR